MFSHGAHVRPFRFIRELREGKSSGFIGPLAHVSHCRIQNVCFHTKLDPSIKNVCFRTILDNRLLHN